MKKGEKKKPEVSLRAATVRGVKGVEFRKRVTKRRRQKKVAKESKKANAKRR